MDDLTDMAVFAGVVEAHGFLGAARQLGLSKAAVSKRIARLEQRLGARLLYRTTRRLSVTESGTTYYEYCARVLHRYALPELSIHALYAQCRHLPAKVRVFIEFLAARFGPEPTWDAP